MFYCVSFPSNPSPLSVDTSRSRDSLSPKIYLSLLFTFALSSFLRWISLWYVMVGSFTFSLLWIMESSSFLTQESDTDTHMSSIRFSFSWTFLMGRRGRSSWCEKMFFDCLSFRYRKGCKSYMTVTSIDMTEGNVSECYIFPNDIRNMTSRSKCVCMYDSKRQRKCPSILQWFLLMIAWPYKNARCRTECAAQICVTWVDCGLTKKGDSQISGLIGEMFNRLGWERRFSTTKEESFSTILLSYSVLSLLRWTDCATGEEPLSTVHMKIYRFDRKRLLSPPLEDCLSIYFTQVTIEMPALSFPYPFLIALGRFISYRWFADRVIG